MSLLIFLIFVRYRCTRKWLQDSHAGLSASTNHFWSGIKDGAGIPTVHLEEERCNELRWMAAQLQKDFPHFNRSAQYYATLVDLSSFLFLAAGPSAAARVGEAELGERPPPPNPHKLKISFRGAPAEE